MKRADERGDPEGYALWDAQVALANCLTRHPGMEGELTAVTAYVGAPPGWLPGDGYIDPDTRPPPPEIIEEMREQEAKERARAEKQAQEEKA